MGSGIYPTPSGQLDVSSAIDALTNGASSLIHGAYLRRQAAIQNQQQKARQDIEDQRYEREQARTREVQDRDYALKVEQQRKQDLANGFTPASTDITLTPPPASTGLGIPADGASAIQSAMTAGLSAGTPAGGASPLTSPVDIGQLPTMNVTETPESYDPTRAASVVRATETARINAERDAARNATTLAARKIMKDATVEAARIRASASKGGAGGGSGGIRGAMTAGQQERKFETVDAPALLGAHDWNLQDAIEDLNTTPEGQALKQAGFTTRHLVAAFEKHIGEQTSAAMRFQTGAMAATPEEATGAVQQTRDLVSKGKGTRAPKPPADSVATQRAMYDKAAQQLKQQGKDPVAILGARP